MFAELRSHGPYEQPGTAGPHLEIALAVRGSDEGLVATKFAGTWRRVRPTTGTIWLRPIATKADECRMAPSAWEAIHLYMSSVVFARLKDDYNLPAAPESSIRYSCGVQDEVINQIGLSVLSEMMSPTAAGRMLVETSSLLLAARLAHSHFETGLIRPPLPSRHGLDVGRLRRVLATSKSISPKTSASPTSPMSRVSASFISPAHLPPPWACLHIATSANGGWRTPRR